MIGQWIVRQSTLGLILLTAGAIALGMVAGFAIMSSVHRRRRLRAA